MLTEISIFFFPSGISSETPSDVLAAVHPVSSRSAGTVSPCQLLYSTSPAKGSKTRLLETFQWKETE